MRDNHAGTIKQADKSYQLKKLAILGLLTALSFLCVLFFRIPVFQFLDFEPKDVVITIAAFMFGPLSGAAISVAVSFIELVTISTTGWIGFVMNVLSSVCFVCPAAYIYKKRHKMSGAVIGLITGSLLMLTAMLLWNYLITPFYMGITREAVTAMLLPVFTPFNLLKSGMNTALVLLLYKPVVTGLRKANLIPHNPNGDKPKSKISIGILIAAGLLLITCVLLFLVVNGTL